MVSFAVSQPSATHRAISAWKLPLVPRSHGVATKPVGGVNHGGAGVRWKVARGAAADATERLRRAAHRPLSRN